MAFPCTWDNSNFLLIPSLACRAITTFKWHFHPFFIAPITKFLVISRIHRVLENQDIIYISIKFTNLSYQAKSNSMQAQNGAQEKRSVQKSYRPLSLSPRISVECLLCWYCRASICGSSLSLHLSTLQSFIAHCPRSGQNGHSRSRWSFRYLEENG